MAKIYVETNKYNADIRVYEVNSKIKYQIGR